jgi:hypothetical protein
MTSTYVNAGVLSQVETLKRVVAETATSSVPGAIVEHLLNDVSAQLLRLRDDALNVSETTAPLLQKYLYETAEVQDLISVCGLAGGASISFSTQASFLSEQLRRNAHASANGLKVRQLFVVSDWLDVALDADFVFSIQSLLHSRASVRVLELTSNDKPADETFTVFSSSLGAAKAALVQQFNRTTKETSLALTIAEARLAQWAERAERLWGDANVFDVNAI